MPQSPNTSTPRARTSSSSRSGKGQRRDNPNSARSANSGSQGGRRTYGNQSSGERRGGRSNDRGRFARRQSARPATQPRPADADRARERELDAALDAAAQVEPADLPESFSDTDLPERLAEALSRRGIRRPFPIQARTLPDALAGRDVLGRAQTGSGKTLAFGLPMLAALAETVRERTPGNPRGLVLVPTRELAQQVADALAPLGRRLGIELTTVYGGSSMRRQVFALRDGVDIVVATPGRLIDLIEQGECRLSDVRISVLDEADYMADLGFLPAVTRILDLTPAGGQRMLFSATLDRGVSRLVGRYLSDPAFHAVAAAAAPIESVEHRVFTLRPEDKVEVAAEIASRPGRSLFFVRTKHGADRLVRQLRQSGVESVAIHGNLKQGARRKALAGFSAGSPRVLIATDVAARGIHVDDVDLVVHFDPSADHKDYLHRSGRTARAGATGTVVSLVHHDQRREVDRMHKQAKVSATAVDVEPGHTAVRDVATSGTPIVVRPQATASGRPARSGRPTNGRGRPSGNRRSSSKNSWRPHDHQTADGFRRGRPKGQVSRGQQAS
ncbi:DEAD/DEAH box helicase [Actinopolymorpha sp. B17G11]|uniref:DEAD/DEAH box helicase n=1 Tax=unclassified Actinopolymorpha TaxID=2627063 RepID=UPI0032D99510